MKYQAWGVCRMASSWFQEPAGRFFVFPWDPATKLRTDPEFGCADWAAEHPNKGEM